MTRFDFEDAPQRATVEASYFRRAVKKLEAHRQSKCALPIYGTALIQVGEGFDNLRLTVCNHDAFTSVVIPATIQTDSLAICVPMEALAMYAAALPDAPLSLQSDNHGKIIISPLAQNVSKMMFLAIPPGDFPELPKMDFSGAARILIAAAELSKLLAETIPFANAKGSDATNGVTIRTFGGSAVQAFATNGKNVKDAQTHAQNVYTGDTCDLFSGRAEANIPLATAKQMQAAAAEVARTTGGLVVLYITAEAVKFTPDSRDFEIVSRTRELSKLAGADEKFQATSAVYVYAGEFEKMVRSAQAFSGRRKAVELRAVTREQAATIEAPYQEAIARGFSYENQPSELIISGFGEIDYEKSQAPQVIDGTPVMYGMADATPAHFDTIVLPSDAVIAALKCISRDDKKNGGKVLIQIGAITAESGAVTPCAKIEGAIMTHIPETYAQRMAEHLEYKARRQECERADAEEIASYLAEYEPAKMAREIINKISHDLRQNPLTTPVNMRLSSYLEGYGPECNIETKREVIDGDLNWKGRRITLPAMLRFEKQGELIEALHVEAAVVSDAGALYTEAEKWDIAPDFDEIFLSATERARRQEVRDTFADYVAEEVKRCGQSVNQFARLAMEYALKGETYRPPTSGKYRADCIKGAERMKTALAKCIAAAEAKFPEGCAPVRDYEPQAPGTGHVVHVMTLGAKRFDFRSESNGFHDIINVYNRNGQIFASEGTVEEARANVLNWYPEAKDGDAPPVPQIYVRDDAGKLVSKARTIEPPNGTKPTIARSVQRDEDGNATALIICAPQLWEQASQPMALQCEREEMPDLSEGMEFLNPIPAHLPYTAVKIHRGENPLKITRAAWLDLAPSKRFELYGTPFAIFATAKGGTVARAIEVQFDMETDDELRSRQLRARLAELEGSHEQIKATRKSLASAPQHRVSNYFGYTSPEILIDCSRDPIRLTDREFDDLPEDCRMWIKEHVGKESREIPAVFVSSDTCRNVDYWQPCEILCDADTRTARALADDIREARRIIRNTGIPGAATDRFLDDVVRCYTTIGMDAVRQEEGEE